MENGNYYEGLKLPEEDFVKALKKDYNSKKDLVVNVIKAMGTEKVISYREGKD